MSEKYIKQTKKGKGRKKKLAIRQLGDIASQIKPAVYLSMSLMIMEDLKKRKKDENRE